MVQTGIVIPEGEPLFVKEETSPMLTDQVVELLTRRGFNAISIYKAPQPLPDPRHELTLQGKFLSLGKVQADLHMDALFDHREDTIKGNRTIGNFLSLAVHFIVRAALPSPSMGGLNLIADAGAVAKVTGAEGAINERMYGDYRGRCTFDCDKRNVSNQRATINAFYNHVVSGQVKGLTSVVITSVGTDTLIPYELIDKSLLEALMPFTDPGRYMTEIGGLAPQAAGQ